MPSRALEPAMDAAASAQHVQQRLLAPQRAPAASRDQQQGQRVRSGITSQKGNSAEGSVSENHLFLTSSDEAFSALLRHGAPEQM